MVAVPTLALSLSNTSLLETPGSGEVAIGELLTFQSVITLPELTLNTAAPTGVGSISPPPGSAQTCHPDLSPE